MKINLFGKRDVRETIERLEGEVAALRCQNAALIEEVGRLREENVKLDARRERTKEAYREMVARWKEAERQTARCSERLGRVEAVAQKNTVAQRLWHRFVADHHVGATSGVVLAWYQEYDDAPREWYAWGTDDEGTAPLIAYDTPEKALDALDAVEDTWWHEYD
jgi:regulator of replication initiation timing